MQIAQYVGGRQRIVKHVGSAHTEAELGVLLAKARELLMIRLRECWTSTSRSSPSCTGLVGRLLEDGLDVVGDGRAGCDGLPGDADGDLA